MSSQKLWVFCGAMVGGVRPKFQICYLLRVKQHFAFCYPLLANNIFPVFSDLRLLPGVLVSIFLELIEHRRNFGPSLFNSVNLNNSEVEVDAPLN